MYDLISFGSVVIDLYFKANEFSMADGKFLLSSEHRKDVEYFYVNVGGGAVNVAIGAKKLGMNVGLASVMGQNSFINTVKDRLDEMNIDYSLSEIQDAYYNVSLVLTATQGERSIINFRSPFHSAYERTKEATKLLNTKALYMANLPNLSLQTREHILKTCQENNITTFTCIGMQDCYRELSLMKTFISLSDIMILNCEEFAMLIKKPIEDIDFNKDVQKLYLPESKGNILILTHGEQGSFGYVNGKVYFQKAVPPKKIVDANGAGDAYTAGFIHSYLSSKDVEVAMKEGAKTASKVIEHLGAN